MILVKFVWDYGRPGRIEGLFATTEEELNKVIGKEAYFGEILGKHSEIFGRLDREDFGIVTRDLQVIAHLVVAFGSHNFTGYNPLDYLLEEDEE